MDKAHVQIGSIGPGFESCQEPAFFPPLRLSVDPTKTRCKETDSLYFVFRLEIEQLASSLDCSPETWLVFSIA